MFEPFLSWWFFLYMLTCSIEMSVIRPGNRSTDKRDRRLSEHAVSRLTDGQSETSQLKNWPDHLTEWFDDGSPSRLNHVIYRKGLLHSISGDMHYNNWWNKHFADSILGQHLLPRRKFSALIFYSMQSAVQLSVRLQGQVTNDHGKESSGQGRATSGPS